MTCPPLKYSFRAGFTGADTYGLLELGDEYLAVADLAGACRVGDRFDDLLCNVVVDRELDLGLRQKVHDILGAAIQFRMAALATEALDLGHGDALDSYVGDGLPDVVEFEGLDDRCDHFHECIPLSALVKGRPPPPRLAFTGRTSCRS